MNNKLNQTDTTNLNPKTMKAFDLILTQSSRTDTSQINRVANLIGIAGIEFQITSDAVEITLLIDSKDEDYALEQIA